MSITVLIVDDEPVQRRLLENSVVKMGYRAVTAETGEEALEVLKNPKGTAIDVVVLDLVMPGLDGMGVLSKIQEQGLACPVIVQTAQGGIDTVVSAIRAGAHDFCVKPVSPERLNVSIQNAVKLGAMEDVVQKIKRTSDGTFTFEDMIAASPAMEKVKNLGERAASSNIPILIEGESGVGKEVIAKAIQGASERQGKPFVTVNCGALPENLVESILFGHEKGAFTGATASHTGKFKEADGGTLFLDEVGELSLDIQVKLLRAIQESEVDPVGATWPVKTDFRLISATNQNLTELVETGKFREDLFYRLNVFPIYVPALRDRKSDIASLVRHFTAQICLEEGRRNISGIRSDALAMLEAFDWPGNIRQLENTIFRAIVLCDGIELTIEEFPQITSQVSSVEKPGRMQIQAPALVPEPASGHHVSFDAEPEGQVSLLDVDGDLRSLENIEIEVIRFAMDHFEGQMTNAARNLGIGRSTLYRKIKENGIDDIEVSETE